MVGKTNNDLKHEDGVRIVRVVSVVLKLAIYMLQEGCLVGVRIL